MLWRGSALVACVFKRLSSTAICSVFIYTFAVCCRVLEQIVSCRDDLAQQYLMQALILAFPDDFHLGTLTTLLGALPSLQPGVKVASVLSSLLDRLAQYAASNPAAVPQLSDADAFGTLANVALSITERRADMPAADVASMHSALLAFAGNVYPERLDHVDRVLGTCYDALSSRAPLPAGKAERELVALLSAPLDKYDVVTGPSECFFVSSFEGNIQRLSIWESLSMMDGGPLT